MNLNELTPQTRSIELLHPKTGAKLGLAIELASLDDPAVQDVKRSWQDSVMEMSKDGKTPSATDLEARAQDMIVAAVKGWTWLKPEKGTEPASWKGEQPEFSSKVLRDMLNTLPWMQRQLDAHAGDTTSFFKD